MKTYRQFKLDHLADDPHGLCPMCQEVDDAMLSRWDAFWRWSDGTPVESPLYYDFAKAKRVSRKYGYALPGYDDNVRAMQPGAFSHATSWRVKAPGRNVQSVMA